MSKFEVNNSVTSQDIQPEINKLVIRCNDIVIQTYQFIRLYVLHKYHNKQELPIINKKFIEYCFKVQGTRDNRGKKSKDTTLLDELQKFYDNEFQPINKVSKFDLKHLSYLLPYLAIQMETNYQVNIKEHFIKYLFRFINITTKKDKSETSKLKNNILNQKEIPDEYKKWHNKHKKYILPQTIKKTIPYDIKSEPDKFLGCMLYMNSIIEKEDSKLYQPLPLRNNIIPKYITLDTAIIINLFAKQGSKGLLLKSVKENQELVWDESC